ncbi:MAG: tetratricopeptide repeat protein [Polyangiaceae bacterium]|nr:tetratricopeptide repeat protein [Polyangiaceae bacterium]
MSIEERIRRVLFAAASCAVVITPALSSMGQDKLRDPAAAEALYLSGRKLVGEGKWAEGCEKFRASLELNAAASTLINLAQCSEHDGKLTQALVEYRRALQVNQDTLGAERKRKLEEVAKAGIAALEPRLARVQLVVANRPTGIEIKRDGLSLPIATIGETIPLDPGEHVFVVTAPGHRKEERKVVLKEGASQTIELLLLAEEKPADATPSPVDKPIADGKPVADDKPIAQDKPSRGVPVWAYVAGGLGLAAVGGAIYFKLDQADAEKTLIDNCTEKLICPPDSGYDPTEDNARKNRSFGLFVGLSVAGAVGIGAAVAGIVYGTRPAKPNQSSMFVLPYVGRGDGGVIVRGAF